MITRVPDRRTVDCRAFDAPMLYIHHANRCETLTAALLSRLDAPPPDPFTAHNVIVPSAAMRRWLSLCLAEHQGICANVRFDYLAQWLWAQMARLVDGVAEQSPFATAILTWRCFAALSDPAFSAAQPRLAVYLADADEVMRYELSAAVAQVFDQYLVYRPDWLQAWAEGRDGAPPHPDQGWQAALWRRLSAELGVQAAHPAADLVAALQRGGAAGAERAGVPACVHVFALPTIAPLHLQLLRQLARAVQVHLYVINPCEAYWFDVVAPGRLARLAARGRDAGHDVGHPLLAAWGRQTQAYLELLLDAAAASDEDDTLFIAPSAPTLLAQLQRDMLSLQPTAAASIGLADDDRSIEVHRCHSPMRELEVLQDHLLGLFAADPSLRPADIVVLTPELNRTAPLIDALFGTTAGARQLPYGISGAGDRQDAPTRTLLAVLGLVASRFVASEVFALLQQPMVARRFGLDDDALADIRRWIHDSGMRWALDASHRAALDVPADVAHTLDDGLNRLFLGYALPPSVEAPFADAWPAGDAAGSRATALGALWRFVQLLRALRQRLQQPLSAPLWAQCLHGVLDDFVQAGGEEIDQLAMLRGQLGEFVASLQQPLSLPVLRVALARHLQAAGGGGMPGGRITFAALGSLRALPYQVVCAIGLNDGAWPGTRPPQEFDLMAHAPRRGDRQRRDEERNVFLDMVLAARGSLYLSYVGRSVRDNSPLPPSVLVSELLEVLVPAIADDPRCAASLARARRRLVVDHPLQAFSIDAFRTDGDPRVRSFNRELADAARRGLAAPAADSGPAARTVEREDDEDDDVPVLQAPFFTSMLEPPAAEWRAVSLEQLIDFFTQPCRYLLRRRLGIELPRAEEPLPDDEPFIADWPARQALAARLMPLLLSGRADDAATLPRLAQAGAEMPGGSFGPPLLDVELDAMGRFATRVRDAIATPCRPDHDVDLRFDIDGQAWRLYGTLADLRRSGVQRWRYDTLRAADVLQAWLTHLLLCARPPQGVEPVTTWHATDSVLRLTGPAQPQALLHDLLRLYRAGLQSPLRFFPKSAWAWAQHDGSLEAASKRWTASAHRPFAEGADPYYRLALRGVDAALDATFVALAGQVFAPLLASADITAS